jgi:hypothetical protein
VGIGILRKERALTPSRRLKLSPAGPMVLHAPIVWERRSLPALNKGQSEKSDWPFPFVLAKLTAFAVSLNCFTGS